MCGIAGIFNRTGGHVDRADLSRMASTLHHRGPDEGGFVLLDQSKVGFVHTRLSVLDLSSGQQPMRHSREETWITFNGEIYNHESLRARLVSAGYAFRTRSDTEVILAAWGEWGENCVAELNGEFAFVIWDQAKRTLFAARDAAGVKPLFYRETQGEVLFASEAKAMLALDRVPRQISKEYLCGPFLGVYPRTVSAFEGIEGLEPGGALTLKDGRIEKRRWWQPRYQVDFSMDFEAAQRGFRRELERAVALRSQADVPVHVYLSGGVDSTSICALMARHQQPGTALTAYTIGFDDAQMDESALATRIARSLGVRHETIRFSNSDLVGGLERAVHHTELAIANPNTMAKLALSGLVRSHGIKVCLTGEGADELLGGYAYFKLERIWALWAQGGPQAREAEQLWSRFQRMEVRNKGLSWYPGLPWRKGPHPLGYPCFNELRARRVRGAHLKLLNHQNLGIKALDDPWRIFQETFSNEAIRGLDSFQISRDIAFNQLSGYLIPNLGDRVEMANSVECRTPFLDRELMEFVHRVPTEHMMSLRELREKRLLRESVKDLLPAFMGEVHKHPFLAPSWSDFRATREGRAMFADLLSSRAIQETGLLSNPTFQALRLLWPLTPRDSLLRKQLDLLMGLGLSLQMLHRNFIARPPLSDPHYRLQDRGHSVSV